MIRDQEKHNLEKNFIWNHITTSYYVNTDLSHESWILEAKSQTTLLQNTWYMTEGMILSIKVKFWSKKL